MTLKEALTHLRDKEKQVLAYRLQGLSLDQIGTKYGITRERVRQIESVAFKRLEKLYAQEK